MSLFKKLIMGAVALLAAAVVLTVGDATALAKDNGAYTVAGELPGVGYPACELPSWRLAKVPAVVGAYSDIQKVTVDYRPENALMTWDEVKAHGYALYIKSADSDDFRYLGASRKNEWILKEAQKGDLVAVRSFIYKNGRLVFGGAVTKEIIKNVPTITEKSPVTTDLEVQYYKDKAELTWGSVGAVGYYEVLYATPEEGEPYIIAKTTMPQYTVKKAAQGGLLGVRSVIEREGVKLRGEALWADVTQEVPLPAKEQRIFLVGDSTVATYKKSDKRYPRNGWGQWLAECFASDGEEVRSDLHSYPVKYGTAIGEYKTEHMTIYNYAVPNYSTMTHIKNGVFDRVFEKMEEGDYVFLQSGHNDASPTGSQHISEEEFAANIKYFVDEVRLRGGVPVLITPIVRCSITGENEFIRTAPKYTEEMQRIAAEEGVLLLDLGGATVDLANQTGFDAMTRYFMIYNEGEVENYPEGIRDLVHLNIAGAKKFAGVLAELLQQSEARELAELITKTEI